MMTLPRHFLVTGPPGCGKTTLLIRLARQFGNLRPSGFYTEEIRESGARQGFRLVGLDGSAGMLAHVRFRSRQRVGRYGVDVAGFEAFLAALDLPGSAAQLVFIDEIGKMECLSPRFVALMWCLLDSDRMVVASVALKGLGLIAEVKGREDCKLVDLTAANRDRMVPALAERIGLFLERRGG